MRRIIVSAVGGIALVLLTVVLTVSVDDAEANGASYLKALGITAVPAIFQTAIAGTLMTVALTATITVIATVRFIRWKANRKSSAEQEVRRPSDYDLYCSMDSLTHRMRDYLKYEGFGMGSDPNEILADCQSLNLTLHKRGFAIPYVSSGSAESMFNVLGSYYTVIGPLLRDGHREDAMELAKSYAEKYPTPS
jgi:hypothetical protein